MRLIVCLLVALSMGCTNYTQLGPCVGVDDEKDPALNYSVSTWNTMLAVFFSPSLIIPVYIVLENIQCPVSRKAVVR